MSLIESLRKVVDLSQASQGTPFFETGTQRGGRREKKKLAPLSQMALGRTILNTRKTVRSQLVRRSPRRGEARG